MESIIPIAIEAFWFILPAYIANSVPVDVSQINWMKKYGTPIDGGKTLWGERILGDSKTWRGLIAGILAGTLVGLMQSIIQPTLQSMLIDLMQSGAPHLPTMTMIIAFLLSCGTLQGDMTASFIKRRIPMKPGDPAPILDQLDFIAGAFIFVWAWTCISMGRYELESLWTVVTVSQMWMILIMTPFIHMIGNGIAFIWQLKKNPW